MIEPQGHGALQLAFEQLKKKLAAEGLFDPARKRPLPSMPERDRHCDVSPRRGDPGHFEHPGAPLSGAAIFESIRHRCRARGSIEQVTAGIDISAVQDGLKYRHGRSRWRSLEDLWTFNEESVARAIAGSGVPVISAVGHETDFTIAILSGPICARLRRRPQPSW